MNDLCHSFLEIANRVWREIDEADRAGLSYGEETITETILLELNRNHSVNVRIKAFSKQVEEPKNGSDWEWWIGKKGQWLGMRIQAKKIKLPNEIFHRLQTYKTKSMSDTQINTLIKVAQNDRLNPAYCLYVHSRKVAPLWRGQARCFAPWHWPNQFGCLIGNAAAVKSTGSNKLADLAHVCFPWHHLVCDCLPTSRPDGSLADSVFAALKYSREAASKFSLEISRIDSPLYEPVQTLPGYLSRLEESEDGKMDEELLQRAKEKKLQGFIIVKELD
jgi:hypothetical protein